MTTWDPFDRQPTPEADAEAAELQADARRRARDERIDQQVARAVARGLAEPTISEQIHDRVTRTRSKYGERIFRPAKDDAEGND